MKRPIIAALALALATTVSADDGAAAAAKKLASMTWLAGEWSGPMWGGEFVAYYSTPEGGAILSFSELRREGSVAFHEFERFAADGAAVTLSPYPGGKPAATFTLTELDEKARKATFENPKKDFPTRIVYQRAAEDRLVITLSDAVAKARPDEVFDLKRR
jgi:hypothetical protein